MLTIRPIAADLAMAAVAGRGGGRPAPGAPLIAQTADFTASPGACWNACEAHSESVRDRREAIIGELWGADQLAAWGACQPRPWRHLGGWWGGVILLDRLLKHLRWPPHGAAKAARPLAGASESKWPAALARLNAALGGTGGSLAAPGDGQAMVDSASGSAPWHWGPALGPGIGRTI